MTPTEPSPLRDFTDQLIEAGAVLSQIVEHMALSAAHRGGSPEALPIRVVLGKLLADVLEPVVDRHGPERVAAGARLIADACSRISDEIYLVPHGAPPG